MTWNENLARFYKANFHTHTTASDGWKTPSEAIKLYRDAGYDILAITDHCIVTDYPEDMEGILVLSGIEYDYMLPGQAIHLLGIGVDKGIDGIWNRGLTPQQTIELIHKHGGLSVLAHPGWSLNDPATIAELKGIDAVEIWNSVSNPPYNPSRADASLLLDSLWSNYPNTYMPVMASDDTHFYGHEFAKGWTMVYAGELTEQAVLSALYAGRFYASCGPEITAFEIESKRIHVRCSPCDYIIFYTNTPWASYRCICGNGLTEAEIGLEENDRYIRTQVIDAEGRSAWTMPISVKEIQR